jgi:hypothetical protein
MPNVALITPIPVGTRSGGNSSLMIPKESGKTAAASPCTARPAISIPIECDSAQMTEPNPNTTSEPTSIRSLPNMSPRRPTIGVATDAVSRKAVKTNDTPVVDVPSSFWIAGSAGATIVCCSAIESAAMSRTASVRP